MVTLATASIPIVVPVIKIAEAGFEHLSSFLSKHHQIIHLPSQEVVERLKNLSHNNKQTEKITSKRAFL